MPVLWSNPNPGPTPAELTAHYQVHGASIGEVLNSIMRQRLHEQQQLQQGVKDIGQGVSNYMAQRKADQVAQTLLDQASNYGSQSYDQPTDYETMARSLNEGDLGAGDAWKALQGQRAAQIKESLVNAQIDTQKSHKAAYDRSQQGAVSPQPMYDESGNIIGYSSGSGAPHFLPREGTSKQPSLAKTVGDAELTDYLNKPGQLGGIIYQDAKGNQVDNDTALKNPAAYTAIGKIGSQDLNMPLDKWLSIRKQYEQATGQPPQLSTGSVSSETAPEVGTQRTVGGKTYSWDGKGWLPVE